MSILKCEDYLLESSLRSVETMQMLSKLECPPQFVLLARFCVPASLSNKTNSFIIHELGSLKQCHTSNWYTTFLNFTSKNACANAQVREARFLRFGLESQILTHTLSPICDLLHIACVNHSHSTKRSWCLSKSLPIFSTTTAWNQTGCGKGTAWSWHALLWSWIPQKCMWQPAQASLSKSTWGQRCPILCLRVHHVILVPSSSSSPLLPRGKFSSSLL